MFTPWRSALPYALWITFPSWAVGIAVTVAGTAGFGEDTNLTGGDPASWALTQVAFLTICTLTLATARRLMTPLPRALAVLTDGILYLAVFGLVQALPGAGLDAALLDGMAMWWFWGMFTLQIPAAWGLSAWRSGHLQAVIKARYRLDGVRP
ncbi:hypothetical protein [Streptomyces sp. NPDC101393]|uniref:hypothetical protein n=1 Tax=Streptomyces sp. NPDC101393 TaxID=3366141 RepID=UPI0037F45FDD